MITTSGQRPEEPNGALTFLFTDIEGSTARWERDSTTMADLVAAHDDLVGPDRFCT